MTCHTGPSGLSTFGRVAPRLCAATGVATDAAKAAQEVKATRRARHSPTFPNIDFIRKLSFIYFASSQPGKPPGAVTETIPMDAVQIENAQQHVRTSLHVVGKDDVAIPFERSVYAADELYEHFVMRRAVIIAYVCC